MASETVTVIVTVELDTNSDEVSQEEFSQIVKEFKEDINRNPFLIYDIKEKVKEFVGYGVRRKARQKGY